MANYSINNSLGGTQQAIGATYKTLVATTGVTASRRIKWYDLSFGTIGTPSDQTYEWDVSRQTAAGTSTTVTPVSIDPADAACDDAARCRPRGTCSCWSIPSPSRSAHAGSPYPSAT